MERGVSLSQSSTETGDPKYNVVCVDWYPSVDFGEGCQVEQRLLVACQRTRRLLVCACSCALVGLHWT
jgi:hypothetical protein